MFAVEVGHNGEDGRELEKGTVALVGLGNEILRGAKTGIGAERIHASAHNDGWIEATGSKH